MKRLAYRIPNTNVFLRDDGIVLPRLPEGFTPQKFALNLAEKLTGAYVGTNLRLMSEGSLGDSILNAAGASNDTRSALKKVVELTEFIVLVGDVIELGVKIADWMGAFGPAPQDPLVALLENIDRRLSQIEDTVLQAWSSSRRDMLAFLKAHSSISLKTAQEYMELGRPEGDVWAARIALADRDSRLAVETFIGSGIDGGFWLRPFSVKGLGVDPNAVHSTWLGHYPDQAQITRNPVWDYRFALPAAAYAITVRLAVLKAVFPQSLQRGGAGCREMKGYANFLRQVAERMQNGIWAINDLDMSEAGQFHFLWSGRMVVAAANIYSGYSLFRIVYAHELPPPAGVDPGLWPATLVDPHMVGTDSKQVLALGRENARLIGSHWWHLIWRGIGMVELCQLISDVDRACTSALPSPSPAPGTVVFPDVNRNDTIGDLLGNAHRLVLHAQTDPRARTAASMASSLVRFTSTGDPVADATRIFEIYRSLLTGGENAEQIVARSNEELLKLIPKPEKKRKPSTNSRSKVGKKNK